MPSQGNNLPGFQALQLDFTAHMRNPSLNEMPSGLEARRVQIYVDLIFNNIESFLSSSFPITKSLHDADAWRKLVRRFVELHPSESPYFLEIPQEFLTFVSTQKDVAPYLLELCHYEWVELALDVAEDVDIEANEQGDLLDAVPVISPYVWRLTYQWAVHQIGPENTPQTPPEYPTYLLAHRDKELQVKFTQSSPLTHRLLELIETGLTGGAAITQIEQELGTISHSKPESLAQIRSKGAETLSDLKARDILLGTG